MSFNIQSCSPLTLKLCKILNLSFFVFIPLQYINITVTSHLVCNYLPKCSLAAAINITVINHRVVIKKWGNRSKWETQQVRPGVKGEVYYEALAKATNLNMFAINIF